MKNFRKILCCIFAGILMFNLVMPTVALSIDMDSNASLEPKVKSNATLEDDFADDRQRRRKEHADRAQERAPDNQGEKDDQCGNSQTVPQQFRLQEIADNTVDQEIPQDYRKNGSASLVGNGDKVP